MPLIFRSFYARLSLIFLVLILALGAGSLVIAFTAAGHLFDEVEQLLNREYAGSIAAELQPLVTSGFSPEAVGGAIHYMMVLNPMVEIYLVDGTGAILAYFTHPEESLVRKAIDPEPLRRFVAAEGHLAIPGDDPRTAGRQKPFSAAPLVMGGKPGFVYVILRGQGYDRSLLMLRNSYFLRSGLGTFLFALAATVLAGLALFFLLTRRLRLLGQGVRAFEQGDLAVRIPVTGEDEIGALGRAFNDMASSVQEGMESLRRSEQLRRELVADISHDLRSPLTSVRGHLETALLREDKVSPEDRRRFLGAALGSVEGLQRLVEELFELARLEARQTGAVKEPFPLAELVQDTALKLKPQAEEARIRLLLSLPEDLPPVNGDIGLLERLLTNLLENALAHTPPEGRVTVSLASGGQELVLTVEDTGPGIPPEDLPRIFDRFYRADRSRAGAGLGLAIVREIVGLHGGTITAGNRPGGGALFRVNLPL